MFPPQHSRRTHFRLQFALCFILFSFHSLAAFGDPRERILIDSGWRFSMGDPPDITNAAETNVTYYPEIPDLAKLQSSETNGVNSETNLMRLRPDPIATHLGENVSYVQANFDDNSWRALDLPHDWVIELPFSSGGAKNHGYKAGINGTTSSNTIAWYRRTFTLPSYTNKTLWLEFDGVYRNSLVWLNGHIIGRNVSGYSSMSFDVSPYAIPGGTNVLVVRVDASRFEGWFYEGAGIYRHVWLVKTDPVHVAHWGTYVTNVISGSNGIVTIQTQVNNDGAGSTNCDLASAIYDAAGNLVVVTSQSVTVGANASNIVTQTLTITNARLWSLDFPNLYRLVSTVTQGTTTNDIYETSFGIRTFTWDANNGLLLNGKRVEAKGVCDHQDHAGVGAAVPDRVNYFRIERLKAMGFNAVRTSHNSPTPEMLDACDRLGMLVMDENRRLGWDPETLGQLQRGILRDRNRACVFMWSLGNEEPLQGNAYATSGLQIMQNLAHQLDRTRLCTVAMHNGWGSGFSTVIDVQGGNYGTAGLTSYHSSHPTQPLVTTEEGSQVGDRNIYTNLNPNVSAYDIFNSNVGWSETVESMWQYHNSVNFVAGFFYWTGFDYRGEPTPTSYPSISSHFGILDTCGYPKDNAWYFQANWLSKPVLHIFPHWNWAGKEGQPISVWCFSSCDMVELFLNGVSQGIQSVNVLGHLQWNVPYAAGTLQAVGYIDGQPVITNVVVTAGSPMRVTLQPDRDVILADGRDVSVVTVSVVDSQWRVVPLASNTITFTVSGGKLLGLGNGNPNSLEADIATNNIGVRSVFNGLAQVIVQSTNQAGTITLTATATGLGSTNTTVAMVNVLPPPAAPTGLVASPDNRSVALGWDVVPGAVTYDVKRATNNGGPYVVIATNTADIGWTDTNVVNGTTYYYVVSALDADGESPGSIQVSAIPRVPFYFVTQPNSFVSSGPVYVGTPITFSATATNNLPITYQWYEVRNGITNLVAGQMNTAFNYLVQAGDTNGVSFFVVAGNGSTNIASWTADLVLNSVVGGASTAPPVSIQFALTNYSGYNGFFLAPAETAGAYGVSNWNVWPITPNTNGTQPGVTFGGLKDCFGAASPVSVTVVNVSDGWHQGQSTTSGSPANQRLMNTFWKVNPNKSTPSASTMVVTLTNVPNGAYSAYFYFMQNASGATGNISGGGIGPYYFSEFTAFNASSNFVTTVSTSSGSNPLVNYLKLPGVVTGGTNCIRFTINYTSGGDGIGVCGMQLVPVLVAPAASAVVTNGQVKLNWNVVSGATAYRVLRATTSGGPYTTNASNLNIANYTDTAVTNGVTYYYVISAVNPVNDEVRSTEVNATLPLPAVPVMLVAGGFTNGQFSLQFSSSNGLNYVVETSSNLVNWTPVFTNAATNGSFIFTDTNLSDPQRFYRAKQ